MVKQDKPTSGGGSGALPAGNRRAKLAALEAHRKATQRRRTVGFLVICVVVVAALLSYPIYLGVKDSQASSAAMADLGVSKVNAGCDLAAESPASGNQEHVADGTSVPYDPTPPGSGPHYASSATFTKSFYAVNDRPAVETLVHNLEHGYTVAWYREGAPQAEMDALQAISKTLDSEQKFIAAPWTSADGAFPDGKNIVLAHWTADLTQPANTTLQKGIRQACTAVSGTAVESFIQTYPSTSSPEPNGA